MDSGDAEVAEELLRPPWEEARIAAVRLRVIGLGTPLGDDAVGIAVVRRLGREHLPPGVELLERERPGVDLLEDLRDVSAAVLVDALEAEGPPGTVRSVAREELARTPRLSGHGLGVADALALAEALSERPPEIRIIAVQVGDMRGQGLSAAVHSAVPRACSAVREALEELAGTGSAAADGGRDPRRIGRRDRRR